MHIVTGERKLVGRRDYVVQEVIDDTLRGITERSSCVSL